MRVLAPVCVLLVLLVAVAGCLRDEASGSPSEVIGVDVPIVVQGFVLDARNDAGIEGVGLRLVTMGEPLETLSERQGGFRFETPDRGPCTLHVESDAFQSGQFELDCTRSRHMTIRLDPASPGGASNAPSGPPSVVERPLVPGPPSASTFVVEGVVEGSTGPVAGADVGLWSGDEQLASTRSGPGGAFAFQAAVGSYKLLVDADCAKPVAKELRVDENRSLTVKLADLDQTPPGAPERLAASPGPGVQQTTLRWYPPATTGAGPIIGYDLYRDGSLFARLGVQHAYGDTGAASHDYVVVARNLCGVEGPGTAAVAGSALPGPLVEAPVSPSSSPQAATHTYPVWDADGEVVGERSWRVVTGLGNCCETYVAADAAGRLYEYGGSVLHFSDDEGSSWSTVSNVIPAVTAEGAVVGAPGGDVLAVNWDPYSGDVLWSHKYVAATDTWYTARTPIHQPFFDRPWVAVIEGPFEVEGVVVPYVSFLMSNYVHGEILLMSLDGLQYQPPTVPANLFASTTVDLRDLGPDPSRDWIQAMRETDIHPIDDGIGLRTRSVLGTCEAHVLHGGLIWGCARFEGLPRAMDRDDVLRVDGAGGLHLLRAEFGEATVQYEHSHDGHEWTRLDAALPEGWVVEDWDVQVNAGLKQTVVAVHASETVAASTIDQDMVFRFRHTATGPVLEEILAVGLGDHPFGGGLTSEFDRFDYTTVTLLPSGHVALSFGDSMHSPPAVAVELAG